MGGERGDEGSTRGAPRPTVRVFVSEEDDNCPSNGALEDRCGEPGKLTGAAIAPDRGDG